MEVFPPDDFEPTHDLYALGVLLLEIGLWPDADSWESGRFLPPISRTGETTKSKLVKQARKRLGFYVGSIYHEVVFKCLGAKTWDRAPTRIGSNTKSELLLTFRREIVAVLSDLRHCI